MKRFATLKTILMGVLFTSLTPLTVSADVNICSGRFPDPIFLEYVKTFDTNNNGILSDSEIAAVTTIDIINKGVRSLGGIQYFTNLQILRMSDNKVGYLDFTKNTKLKYILCYHNRISHTAMKKMLSTLPTYESGSNTGTIYFRYSTETEATGQNTEAWDYTTANAKGWLGQQWVGNHYENISANSTNTVSVNEANFPDENFRTFIISKYGSTITYDKIDKITELDVSNKGIKSLKGIEKFTALESLKCQSNHIMSLDLSYNAQLNYLNVSFNRLFGTEMDNFAENLPAPIIWINQTSDYGSGKYMTFAGGGNTMTEAQRLVCQSKYWVPYDSSGTSPVSEVLLYINATTFPDENFRYFINKWFGEDGKITEDELETTSLTFNDLHGVIEDARGIEYFENLTNLYMTFHRSKTGGLSSIDVSRNTKLTDLILDSDMLTSIDLSKNTELVYLSLSNNQLSNVTLPASQTLQTICMSYNLLSSINVPDLPNLNTLELQHNNLNSLDVSRCTNLFLLSCNDNNLSTLRMPASTELVVLDCLYNKLQSLDLSKNTGLRALYCSQNRLTSLQLPTSNNLSAIFIDNNLLDEDAMTDFLSQVFSGSISTASSKSILTYSTKDGVLEGNFFSYDLLNMSFDNNWKPKYYNQSGEGKYYDKDNILIPCNVAGNSGSQVTLPIEMVNNKEVSGFSFDLVLPTGVTLTQATVAPDRLPGFTVTTTLKNTDGTLDANIYNIEVLPGSSTDRVQGTSGTVLNVKVQLTEGTADFVRIHNGKLKIPTTDGSTEDYEVGPLSAASPKPHAVLNNNTLTFYYRSKPANGMDIGPFSTINAPKWSINSRTITKVEFDESFANYRDITSTAYWFDGFDKLVSVTGIENLKTINVTDMKYMFRNCKSLSSLDLSTFKTNRVRSMEDMFYNCSNLTVLDLSNFDTESIGELGKMFYNCQNLHTIYCLNRWVSRNFSAQQEISQNLFEGCISLVGGDGTQCVSPNWSSNYAHPYSGGYFTKDVPYAVLSDDNKTLTFYCDQNKESRNGMGVGPFTSSSERGWFSNKGDITHVVFDESMAKCNSISSTAFWFTGFNNLTTITGIKNLNTSNVTSMANMFYTCSSLTSLDVDYFNTEKVRDMSKMFYLCINLQTIVCDNTWNRNTKSDDMFYHCSRLVGNDGTTCPLNNSSTVLQAHPNAGGYFTKKGNVNGGSGGDANVTPADAIMILYHYFGVEQTGFNAAAADLNGDNAITPADAIEALYKYFGSSSGSRATRPAAADNRDPE